MLKIMGAVGFPTLNLNYHSALTRRAPRTTARLSQLASGDA